MTHPTTEEKTLLFLVRIEDVLKNQAMSLATLQHLNEELINLLHDARRDLTDTTDELERKIDLGMEDDLTAR